MIDSTEKIIEETNRITNGLYDNAHKPGERIIATASYELKIASMEAASRIMQAKIIAEVFDSKSFW